MSSGVFSADLDTILTRYVVEHRPPLVASFEGWWDNYRIASTSIEEARDQAAGRLASVSEYHYVVIDCGPSLSLLNMNALCFAGEVIIPVVCDFLSLVGLRQAMKTIERVNSLLAPPFAYMACYRPSTINEPESVTNPLSAFVRASLSPTRVNTRLKEAPSFKQTIFDYAPIRAGQRIAVASSVRSAVKVRFE